MSQLIYKMFKFCLRCHFDQRLLVADVTAHCLVADATAH